MLAAFKHRKLILSIRTFPAIPKNWRDSEEVRIFTSLMAKSPATIELVAIIPMRWTANTLSRIGALAENKILWGVVWTFIADKEIDRDETSLVPKKLTFRERVRQRLDKQKVQTPEDVIISSVDLSEVEDLITFAKNMQLLFDKDSGI